MPKAKEKQATPTREVLYKTVHAVVADADKPITVDQAKELLGWQEVSDASTALLKDRNGKSIQCCNTTEKQRPYTPALARQWMCEILGKPKQAVNPKTSLGGNWQLTGEAIVVGRTGLNIEGQHRLIGLVLAAQEWAKDPKRFPGWKKEPVLISICVFGIDEAIEVVNVMNTGKPRSLAEALYASGMFNKMNSRDRKILTRMVDYGVRLLWLRTGASINAFAPRRTHAESLDFINRHPKLLKCVQHICEENADNHIAKYIGPGYASGLLYLMATSSTDPANYRAADNPNEKQLDWELWSKACDFWVSLAGGEPGFAPVRKALANILDEGGGGLAERCALLIKTWLCYANNKPITDKRLELAYDVDEEGFRTLTECPISGGIDLGIPEESDEPVGADPTPEEIRNRAKTERDKRKAQQPPEKEEEKKSKRPKQDKKLASLIGKVMWVRDENGNHWRGKVVEATIKNAQLKVAQGFQGAGNLQAALVSQLHAKQPG